MRFLLASLLLLGCGLADGEGRETAAKTSPLDAGVTWLVAQQSDEDGGWHSETYGALRPGAAMTALAVYTLSRLDDERRAAHLDRMRRAYKFLRPGIETAGCVANPDGSLDYPTYASALLLVAADRVDLGMTAAERKRLLDYLLQAQLTEDRGFDADSPHHGGWDLMGGVRAIGVTPGSNISVTAYVVEALRTSDDPRAAEALRLADRWLTRCRTDDGGFVFHPEPDAEGNKARWHDDDHRQPRAYGTTTGDALRTLVAVGAKRDEARVVAAAAWLTKNHQLERVPGFEQDDEDEELRFMDWEQALRFYYYAALAQTLDLLPRESAGKIGPELARHLAKLQKEDGRWENESAHMREDDPLIATCLALLALAELSR